MKCKKCGQEISDTTKFCKYCGEAVQNGGKEEIKHKKMNMLPFIIGCILAIAVMIVATIWFLGSSKGQDGLGEEPVVETESATDENRETSALEENVETETTEEETTQEATTAMPTEAPTTAPMPVAATQPQTQAPIPTSAAVREYVTYYVVNCQESITLRSAPNTLAGEIVQIPLGAPVSYVETAENGFYKVIYNGNTGYALASYLSTSQPQATGQGSVSNRNNYPTYYVVNCNEWITLRQSPDVSSAQITTIPLGAAVSFVEVSSNGFYKIIYNGNTGYALASYLSGSQ